MESNYYTAKREDRQLIFITHLCQLLTFFTAVGGLIVPLILWLTQRDKVTDMNEHGKGIVNFQLSLIVLYIVCIPLIIVFGIGLLGFVLLGIIGFIYPIINAIKASNGELPKYPLSFNFVS